MSLPKKVRDVFDFAVDMANTEGESGYVPEINEVRAALAELFEASQAIIPTSSPEWLKAPKGWEFGQLGMERQTWERFVAALARARGDA